MANDPEALPPPFEPQPQTKPQRPRRILVAYNHTELSALADAPEPEPSDVAELTSVLRAQGFDVFAVNAEDDCDRLGDAVVVYRPDIILNLMDHFHGDTLLAGPSASLLDIYEYPYIGGDSLCIGRCQDRLTNRLILTSAGVRVPAFVPVWSRAHAPHMRGLRPPVIITQTFDDIYHREDDRAVVENEEQLAEQAAEILADYDPPLIVEEYIGELAVTVVVIANRLALSPCEVFRDEEDEWQVILAELTEPQEQEVRRLAIEASVAMGCRDWSQVEMAIDGEGGVYVTDVRPFVLPLHPESPFRVAAGEHEAGVGGVLAEVVRSALDRAAKNAKLQAVAIAELNENGPTEVADPSNTAAPSGPSSQ